MSLISELGRRKVFKVGAAYVIVAWLAVQAASIGFPAFEAPPWALQIFILAMLLGFPVTLVIAWVVELTPEGARLEMNGRGSKRLFTIAALLAALAIGWFVRGISTVREADTASTTAPAPAVHDTSIAVLPFVNLSSDKEQEYFSDGLSEELLNMLAQVPQLRVIARTSSFSFKGKTTDVGTIAHTLNVTHVLEGSVRKSGTTVRINVHLVRVSDSSQLWSQTYDRKMTDVLEVQDDIAGAVVDALKVKLLPEQRVINPHRSENSDAYDQFLLGNQFQDRANEQAYGRAVTAYRRAIALDPGYAAAYAALAVTEVFVADYAGSPAEHAAAKERALAAAENAISLAPELADGYAARGWMRTNFLWEWDGARTDFEKALALDPGNSTVRRRYGQLLASLGRLPDGIAAIRKAVDMDPLSASVWGNLGYYLMADGQFTEARQALNRALAINPDSNFSRSNLALVMLLQGEARQALAMFKKTGDGFRQTGVALAEHSLGHPVESQRALDELIAAHAADWSVQIAEVYAWRGEKDKAFEWLERAHAQHDGGLSDIKLDPLLAALRDDERFAALERQMGLG